MVGLDGKRKKGMWEGKRGKAMGCEHNQAERDAERIGLQKELAMLFDLLRDVEKAIDKDGDTLRLTQPTAINKIGLRWWQRAGKWRYLDPVLVRWTLQGNGAMTPKPLERLQLRKDGSFALNYKETLECVEILRELIKERSAIRKRISIIKKTMQNIGGASYAVNDLQLRLEKIKLRAVTNLVAAGYEVEPSLFEEDE